MKCLFFAIAALTIAGLAPACSNQKVATTCFKGRMEDRGLCGNYTISLLEGNLPGVADKWTNEQSGKTYYKVFRPANPCAIPDNLKAGDTFYFTLDSGGNDDCIMCMAVYPAPAARIRIRVQEGGCAN